LQIFKINKIHILVLSGSVCLHIHVCLYRNAPVGDDILARFYDVCFNFAVMSRRRCVGVSALNSHVINANLVVRLRLCVMTKEVGLVSTVNQWQRIYGQPCRC